MATCSNGALSRDLLVNVQVSKQSPVTTIDLANQIFVTTEGDGVLDPGAPLRYYTDTTGVLVDFASTTEAYKAAAIFFAQSPRPVQFGIGRIFTAAFAGFAEGDELTALAAAFIAIADGEFAISIDGVAEDITGLDFTLDTDLDDVAATIQAGLQAVAAGGFTAATCVYDSANNRFVITSGTTGDGSTVGALSAVVGGLGTDISGESYMNMTDPRIVDGRTPVGIADELSILDAYSSGCLGIEWSAVSLNREFRDDVGTGEFTARKAAAWALGAEKLIGIDSEDPDVLDASVTDDIASDLKTAGNRFACVNYHPTASQYTSVSALARLLGADLFATGSFLTLNGKDMPGIDTVKVTVTQYDALKFKRANFLSLVQVDTRYYQFGMSSNSEWWIDQSWFLKAMASDVQSAVLSVLKVNNFVGFNSAGQGALYNAMARIGDKYVNNGFITSREDSGGNVTPPYTIAVPIPDAAERAARNWPGITMDINLTGATHTVTITINAFD